ILTYSPAQLVEASATKGRAGTYNRGGLGGRTTEVEVGAVVVGAVGVAALGLLATEDARGFRRRLVDGRPEQRTAVVGGLVGAAIGPAWPVLTIRFDPGVDDVVGDGVGRLGADGIGLPVDRGRREVGQIVVVLGNPGNRFDHQLRGVV